MKLWLVRHAQPLIDAGICYGRLDMAADAEATAECAAKLATQLPAGLRVVSSPLQRCELLALDLQALRPDLAFQTDARLAEMDFGAWEGQPWDAIARTQIDAWANDLAHVAPGGGENLQQMLARVDQALRQTLAASGDITDRVWITHAGVIRCVQWLLQHGQQLPQSHQWDLPAPTYGQWLQVTLS